MQQIYHEGKYYDGNEIKKIVLEYYQDVSKNRYGRHIQMQQLFPESLNKDSNILDYGCGMGGVSKLFADKYSCHVDAVDISANELEKAKITYSQDNINFIHLDDFHFNTNYYDLVFSSQVIEHVHNPGNYLSKINNMLKTDGILIIGLPNIVNFDYLINLVLFTPLKAKKHSKNIIDNYFKATHHINGWDPYHFITLLASCGFELLEYLPTEGTPISMKLKRIPVIGKYIYKMPFTTRLSYTMFFVVKKAKNISIGIND
jgi:2-polyprenyl-3-methyl-5-hydroxy-6-metoxy-1,4-benzoquinol methylase